MTQEGKIKKKIQNGRRGKKEKSANSIQDTSDEESSNEAAETLFDEQGLHYIQVVTSLIEGRWVSLYEILVMLKNRLRQHSMYRQKRFGYAFRYLRARPP